ncbi:hypothetical protein KSP39_PZI017374 [Platanthera zijinensis]|uniref:Photosystem I reaction center subunit N, chloroplastic n=1 Tax=Platanthera zijinensis TaxID=2320716 RepID=A0AAP0B5E3_9ASPA
MSPNVINLSAVETHKSTDVTSSISTVSFPYRSVVTMCLYDAESEVRSKRVLLLPYSTSFFWLQANRSYRPSSTPNAGIFDEYLERSKANKELNDKKRLATSGANLARAYTVEFGTCKFPENFTGCQDLAKQKKVKFLTEDLEVECEGKDKYKCGSNVFWKW